MKNFKIQRKKNSAVVEFRGEQFIDTVLEQKEKLTEIMEDADKVELVFNKDVHLHAAQLQLILAILKELQRKGKKPVIKGLKNKSVRKQFEVAGCFHFLKSLTSN